jgi:CheY-specific phosphatase CheX
MKTSISEVLETMFFLPIDFSDASGSEGLWKENSVELAVARITFEGPFAGRFDFVIPMELALSTTAGFLGKDEESVSPDHAHETIKEIANMVAGNTFSHYDNQAVFDLGIPELIRFDEFAESLSGPEDTIFISCDTLDGNLAFQMVIHS